MILSDEEFKNLKLVLQDLCHENHCVTRDEIYKSFQKKTQSSLEKYKFNKELSRLVKDKYIVGYEIRQGRNGGIIKTEPIERITVIYSSGNYTGCISQNELSKLLQTLKH